MKPSKESVDRITSKELVDRITGELADKGLIIEGGWVSFQLLVVPRDASGVQLDELRNAFFAGAQHLFGSIMTILDPGTEPTEKDLRRMALIDNELKNFSDAFRKKHKL